MRNAPLPCAYSAAIWCQCAQHSSSAAGPLPSKKIIQQASNARLTLPWGWVVAPLRHGCAAWRGRVVATRPKLPWLLLVWRVLLLRVLRRRVLLSVAASRGREAAMGRRGLSKVASLALRRVAALLIGTGWGVGSGTRVPWGHLIGWVSARGWRVGTGL